MVVTPCVRLKSGAAVQVLASAGIRILSAIDRAALALGGDLLITSGSEDMGRDPHDPHMTGEAFDVGVAGLETRQIVTLYHALTTMLGEAFTVLLEAPPSLVLPADLVMIRYPNIHATGLHLHIQRKKGTVWP